MDLTVSSPNAVALNPQQGAAVPVLKVGEIIDAQVLQLIDDTTAKLAIGNTLLEVQTQVPLTVGTTVRLAVKSTPDGLRLTLVGNSTTTSASATPSSGNTQVATAASTSATETPPTVNTTATAAQATTSAATAAAADPTVAAATGNGATTATASNAPVVAIATDPQAQPVVPPTPAAAAAAALASAVQSSAARQNGLAPLIADATVAATVPALPEPVRQAAERLLALQPVLDESTSADDIKQALGRSGLFLEASLAELADGNSGALSAAAAAAAGAGDDLKAALMVLRGALTTFLANDPGAMMQAAGADAGAPNGAALKAGTAALDLHASLATAAETAGAKMTEPQAAAPPPPYRGAPPSAQPAAAPTVSADMTPRDIGKVLLGETDAALARQTLLQAASLPSHPGADPRLDPTGPRWNFEVPFATPQGSTVAQFEIARDGRNEPADGTKSVWRARFSLNLEPIGPVHAQIALVGTRAAVTLWAERPATSEQLRDNAPDLTDALRKAELEPSDVLVRGGTPPRPRDNVGSGRFLDRAS